MPPGLRPSREVITLPDIQLLSPLAARGYRLESRWIHIDSVDTSSRYSPSLSRHSCWRRRSVRKGQGIPVTGDGECCADQSLGQSWSRQSKSCAARAHVRLAIKRDGTEPASRPPGSC